MANSAARAAARRVTSRSTVRWRRAGRSSDALPCRRSATRCAAVQHVATQGYALVHICCNAGLRAGRGRRACRASSWPGCRQGRVKHQRRTTQREVLHGVLATNAYPLNTHAHPSNAHTCYQSVQELISGALLSSPHAPIQGVEYSAADLTCRLRRGGPVCQLASFGRLC